MSADKNLTRPHPFLYRQERDWVSFAVHRNASLSRADGGGVAREGVLGKGKRAFNSS